MFIFRQKLSSIKGCLQSNITFHERLSIPLVVSDILFNLPTATDRRTGRQAGKKGAYSCSSFCSAESDGNTEDERRLKLWGALKQMI